MKYKVGDRVKYGSEICTVTKVIESQGKFKYRVQSDTWFDIVNEDEMIEGLVEEETKPNIIEEAKTYWDSIKDAWICPEGYIFKDENGNVINATKIVLEKKKKEYPKTYEECCKVLGLNSEITDSELLFYYPLKCGDYTTIRLPEMEKFEKFIQLYLCRNAYWKIAGEEIGLGKPWKPDWLDDNLKPCIGTASNEIIKCTGYRDNAILAFPTEEMRDAFYENFKKEIEQCKELL